MEIPNSGFRSSKNEIVTNTSHALNEQPVEHPEDGEAGADGVARLDADEAGYPALGVRLEEGGRVVGEAHVVRVLCDEALDQVDLLQGHLNRVLVLRAARRVGHPQLQVAVAISTVQGGPSGHGQPFVDFKLGVMFSIRSLYCDVTLNFMSTNSVLRPHGQTCRSNLCT